MLNEIKKDADARMKKSVASLQSELAKIRTGRAHPSLLEHIRVEYYGTEVPLNQAANISTEDARTLSVVHSDSSMVSTIATALVGSDLGLHPPTAGTTIRIPLPPLSEEGRAELVRVAHGEGEQAKIAIRNIRRDSNGQLKDFEKDKELSEDEVRRGEAQIQELTDGYVTQVDELVAEKERELMEI